MRVSTALWSLILTGSITAIGVGFAGGRSYAHVNLTPRPLHRITTVPEPVSAREAIRLLRGAHSQDTAPDDVDPFGDVDAAVAMRPHGWAPASFDARHDRARIAVIVVGADREASALPAFAAEPFPLAVLIPGDAAAETLRVARDNGKTALVDCRTADLATIVQLRRAGAAGIACSTADDAQAKALVAANGGGLVLDDLLADDDALYRTALRFRVPAITRDVTVDARSEDAYVDFLLTQALAIAQRGGVATVAVHARERSRAALERFVTRARRDGAEMVDLTALAGSSRVTDATTPATDRSGV